jgi:hypothetical protein
MRISKFKRSFEHTAARSPRKIQDRILRCSMLDHQVNNLISMDDRADLIGLSGVKVLQ